MADRIYNKEQLEEEWEKAKKKFYDDPTLGQVPHPPLAPLSRLIREGTIGDCPKCHSTTIKRFIWFGMSIGYIQPKCDNYYKKSHEN